MLDCINIVGAEKDQLLFFFFFFFSWDGAALSLPKDFQEFNRSSRAYHSGEGNGTSPFCELLCENLYVLNICVK